MVIPLLFETTTYQKIINESLLIDCSEELQLKRIIKRDGITNELAKKIMGAQMTRNKKINEADTIIENNGSKNILKTNILYYHKNILEKLNEKLQTNKLKIIDIPLEFENPFSGFKIYKKFNLCLNCYASIYIYLVNFI